jgi:hypothetical protein
MEEEKSGSIAKKPCLARLPWEWFTMMRQFRMLAIFAASVVLVGSAVPAQSAPAVNAANRHKPKLAVAVSAQEPGGQNVANLEDLLMIELANQPFLQLVDRQAMQKLLREHAVALSNLSGAQNALALGRFAQADYLLHVLLEKKDKKKPDEKKAAIRLVEVATGQVKLETQIVLNFDPALSSAAIRERVLVALRPESQAANRLTVGIAAFSNRSGTDRSDKLGVALQKALRRRLQSMPWAVVLERQYPTALLEEVDLARAGLVRDKAVETLPPADFVILGTMEDVDKEYEAGKTWAVKLALTLRLRGQTSQIETNCRSDGIEAAADDIMRKLQELRRQPASKTAVPEKELWRRQALYLMPGRGEYWISVDRTMWQNRVLLPNFNWLSETSRQELIRAWENVLLLDDRNTEALNTLGVYLISIDHSTWVSYRLSPSRHPELRAATEQCIAASHLVERALRIKPSRELAASYVFCLRKVLEVAPARGREMAQYIQDHPAQFKDSPDAPWVKIALTLPDEADGSGNLAALDRALAYAAKDPDAVLILFKPGLTRADPTKRYAALLAKYEDSPDPVAQFVVQRALGELLCWQDENPAALEHFDKAIAVMEAAYARCKEDYRDSLSNIYRLRIEACQLLGRPDEARHTALAGAKHFQENGRFDAAIAWLYDDCVTQVFGPGREKEALAICDAYRACVRDWERHYDPWYHVSAKREELLTKLAGKRPPDMGHLRFINGSRAFGLKWTRMAAARGAVWFVSHQCYGDGQPALMCRHGEDVATPLPGVPRRVSCMAAAKDAVYFGGFQGLCKTDMNGVLLKLYSHDKDSFPGYRVSEVCEGGGRIYFAFQGSPNAGIAVLDPATEKVSVLAPSGHDATWDTEPIVAIRSIWWDAVTPRLYASAYFIYDNETPWLRYQYTWTPQEKSWRRCGGDQAARFVVANPDETLVVHAAGSRTEFRFVKAGKTTTAEVPLPSFMGNPAFDAHRVWVPTASGLYEVDRATGRVTWLAYDDGNWFISVLKSDDLLYVATSRGMYYSAIVPYSADASASLASLRYPAKPTTSPTSPVWPNAATGMTPERPAQRPTRITLPVVLSLEDDAKRDVTVVLDSKPLAKKLPPGAASLELSVAAGVHTLNFRCPGYAAQWAAFRMIDGMPSPKEVKVNLFRKRYAILRCVFNVNGGRELQGENVEEQHIALSHATAPKHFTLDWLLWQSPNGANAAGDTLYFRWHRQSSDNGFVKPAKDVSYDAMTEAPKSGYRCEEIKLTKGLALYCHVNGNRAGGLGYGKIIVEDITETPPPDVRVIDRP